MSNRLLRRDHRTPTLDLNFLAMDERTFDRRITFSRPSHAMMFDATGKLTLAPNNIISSSNSAFAHSWNCTFSEGAAVGPFGANDANLFIPTASNTSHGQAVYYSNIGLNNRFVYSIYAKAKELFKIKIGDIGEAGTVFDLTAGTVLSGPGSIQNVGNGWYRCIHPYTATYGSGVYDERLLIYDITGALTTYSGNGTDGIYFAHRQLERVTYQTTARPYNFTSGAAYYGPRLDYDPITLAARGLLIEEARTNLCVQSQNLAPSGSWSSYNSGASVVTNDTEAPDGTMTAERLTCTTSDPQHSIQQHIPGLTSTNTKSVFLKYGNYRWVALSAYASGAWRFVIVDLLNGVLGLSSAEFSNVSLTPAGNGWYRVAGVNALGDVVGITFMGSNSLSAGTFAAAGTEFCYAWGFQAELGSFPTSYIPTTTASVARSADVARVDAGAFAGARHFSSGAIYSEIEFSGGISADNYYFTMSTGSTAPILQCIIRQGMNMRITYSNGGNLIDMQGLALPARGSVGRAAVSYSPNLFSFAHNNEIQQASANIVPFIPNNFDIGHRAAAAQVNSHCRRFAVWTSQAGISSLAALTRN